MAVSLQAFREFAGWEDPPSTIQDSFLATHVTDTSIQKQLDISVSIVKDLLAFDQTKDLPDEERIDQAVYTLSLYFLENRSTQEGIFKFGNDAGAFSFKRTSYYRERLEPAIFRKVTGLINPWRSVTAFMEVEDEAS